MVLGHVVEEVFDVAAPVGDRPIGGDVAVRLLGAVAAVPDFPGLAADVGIGDLRADGLDAAVAGEPR